MTRKLAHIELIEEINPIPNADAIEVVSVLGWRCVAKKGEFSVGDKVIYWMYWILHWSAGDLSDWNGNLGNLGDKMIKISKEERDSIVAVMQNKFEEFKVNNSWGLTEEMEDNYKEGVIDLLDSLVSVFGSYQSIYDISTLRDELEEKFEEMNGEE